jgi:AsmA-like C-terminal region
MIETVPKQPLSGSPTARTRRIALWAASICTAALVLGWIALNVLWPFTREKVQADLGDATGSTVVVKSLHKTFFPPGCVMKDVTLTPLQNPRATVHIQQLTIRSSYARLLSKHVDMSVDGAEAHLPIPGQDTGFRFNTKPKATVDALHAKNSVLLFHSQANGRAPLRFEIHELVLKHPGIREEMPFDVKLSIPEPPGELQISGKVGPWRSDNSGQTPLSGIYSLQRADLAAFRGIRGLLSSQGHFDGNIEHIQVQGSADTPDFEVAQSGHKVHVAGDYRVLVNGTNGDVSLEDIHASFARTRVESSGTVAKGADGRTADLKLSSREGRIQDVLMLFIKAPVSPITGDLAFNANAKVPGTLQDFVRKVQFTSDFTIRDGHLTNPNTQYKMDHLSQEAQGKKETDDPANAISDVTAHVELRDGVANFTNLKFRVPGALAHLHGTYDLTTEKIDMHGLLLMQADLPHATSGIKSFLLKPINIFLRKNRHGGARIPVTITGTYDKPVYKTDPM